MGALNGSITYTRFLVDGTAPDMDSLIEAARQDVFVPLTPESGEDERVGWCCIEHPFDLELTRYKASYNEYVNLGFRTDKYRIPGLLLKAHYTEAEREFLAEVGRQRVSRDEKEDIKAIVVARLKGQILPSMSVIDMSWNTQTGHVRFWSQSARACESFAQLFEDSFGLRLIPESPYIAAIQHELDDEQVALLAEIDATNFCPQAA